MKKGIKPRYTKPKRKAKPSKSAKVFRQVLIAIATIFLIAGILMAFRHLFNNHLKP